MLSVSEMLFVKKLCNKDCLTGEAVQWASCEIITFDCNYIFEEGTSYIGVLPGLRIYFEMEQFASRKPPLFKVRYPAVGHVSQLFIGR